MSIGTMAWNHTGTWRTVRPVSQPLLPPRELGCSTGGKTRAVSTPLTAGKAREAWGTLLLNNPLPAVCGRVCPHPCEPAGSRGETDEPLSLRGIERTPGDLALERGRRLPRPLRVRPESVGGGGAGPAGLACVAYPEDRAEKFGTAREIRGLRFIHLLAPCPPGWKCAPELSIALGRMAVRSRYFPLYEMRGGENWRITVREDPTPLPDYLAP